MSIDRLDAFFHPGSIAVVGASDRPGSVGRALVCNIISNGFAGPVYSVNWRHRSVMGEKAYPTVADIGKPVDLVVVATPIQTVPEVIGQCSRIGAAAAVIVSDGGKETGLQGQRVEAAILEAAMGSELRIIGPNCLGIMCNASRLNASFGARLPLDGKLALVSQSGAICAAILDFSIKAHIGISHFVTLGSMLDVDFGDMIDYLGTDPTVSGIVMYVESLTRQRKFMSAARAVSRVKPIIALKAGRSKAGARAVAAHTGAKAGEDAVYDAAFQRAGIVRVNTFEELFDAAEILSRKYRFKGPALAIITNSGGTGVITADALSDYGMQPATLSSETLKTLDAALPDHWSHGNPVDLLSDATPEQYCAAVSILARAPEVQALLVMQTPLATIDAGALAQTLIGLFKPINIPVITSWMGGEAAENGRERFNQAGIATFETPERAVRAFMNLYCHVRSIEMLQQVPPRLSKRIQVDRPNAGRLIQKVLTSHSGLMSEYESKSLIEAYGIPVFPTATAATVDEAVLTAEQLGFPVVMKILSRNIAHKTGVGGVRLKLENAADVRHGFDDILASARAACPGATIDGVTLQPTIIDPHHELFLGAKKDPDFGPVIRFGAGGILAELLDDRAVALPPLNRLLAARLMEGTRVDRLFKDHPNHLPVDRERLEGILISLSQLVTDFPEIAELDINPLVILKGRPMAVDVRVVLEPTSSPAPMHLAISPYPAHHEATVQLPGIGELLIRPIRPEDAPLLSELFETLSPQSIYYRFFAPIKQISPATLARFTQIDYDREIALVAIQGSFPSEKLLGAARVILQRNLKDAEFSVLVGDPWQGKGIGAHLLATCLGIARERRFGKIWGAVMPENKGMLALGRKLGFTIARAGLSGEYNLTVDLAGSTYRQPHRPESKEEVSHEDNR